MTTTECKYYRDKDKECDVWGIPCEMKDCYFKENEKLKEEVEIKDNISEDFRKKALEWAEIANNYFKENSRLYKVLQEIKEIAEQILNKNEFVYMNYRDVRQIIRLITKVKEE